MASKTLFSSTPGKLVPAVTTMNEAGGVAYGRSPKEALAQYAVTGTLADTFYASAETQLNAVLALCGSPAVEPEFIARTAIYARQTAHMKDLPALLAATLTVYGPGLLAEIFDRVIDDGRMLRNFVQIVRSGVVGRKSLGSLPKRLVNGWFDARTDEQIFRASVGNDPSLADVIRMTHPKPLTPARAALYGYLVGQPHDANALPELVKQFEAFKAGRTKELPDVPFQMLTSLELTNENWQQIARNGSWQMTRQNLNTFARHGVFETKKLRRFLRTGRVGSPMTRLIANRLRDKASIQRSRVLPYQLLVAYTQVSSDVPAAVKEALQDAMEIATANVPKVNGRVVVCPDVSGSMHSPVTESRPGATSVVRCVDVAALVAACFVRTNPDAEVIPFTHVVVPLRLNPRDSVMTNAQKMAAIPPGATDCSAPLADLNRRREEADLVVLVSDNESWVDKSVGRGTATMREWATFKARNPRAKLVCIDLAPYGSTQAVDSGDNSVLNVGGFGDGVFDVIRRFYDGDDAKAWVKTIEAVSI